MNPNEAKWFACGWSALAGKFYARHMNGEIPARRLQLVENRAKQAVKRLRQKDRPKYDIPYGDVSRAEMRAETEEIATHIISPQTHNRKPMKHTIIAIIEIEAPTDFFANSRSGEIEECIHRNLSQEPAGEGADIVDVRVALPARPDRIEPQAAQESQP